MTAVAEPANEATAEVDPACPDPVAPDVEAAVINLLRSPLMIHPFSITLRPLMTMF
jgi:hypothetical protein